MNNRAKLARFATWNLFREAAAETTGVASPLYRAALRGLFGKDPVGTEFCAVAARLSDKDHARLSEEIERLDVERVNARCNT